MLLFAFGSLILGVIAKIVMDNIVVLIPFALVSVFLCVKSFLNFQLLKNDKVINIEAVCTNQKKDIMNFGVNRIYEFEALDTEKFKEIIYLSIPNEDTKGAFKKNQKLRIGYTYNLLFKKSKNNTYTNENFLCFARSSCDSKEEKD